MVDGEIPTGFYRIVGGRFVKVFHRDDLSIDEDASREDALTARRRTLGINIRPVIVGESPQKATSNVRR